MKLPKIKSSGFTLIELLIAIAILAIIASFGIANLRSGQNRARDAQRKSDIRQIQSSLRLYYNDYGKYPGSSATSFTIMGCGANGTTECQWGAAWTAGAKTYMDPLAKDPLGYSYRYARTDLDSYTLSACLENKNDSGGKATTNTSWCPTGWMFEMKQ